ncbi:hypothetical protein [Streptomyces sp. SID12488]|uniref:hypothetical protein n=1 Tax=Streptomyces sp. SID12488 TaxID=2706040 RepID=UPI0013DA78B3|nr:hypothetical protein [Streptomyces sp. SID12488]NEA68666.1 hypothetical protein [Streptomyces sp. SID12488]
MLVQALADDFGCPVAEVSWSTPISGHSSWVPNGDVSVSSPLAARQCFPLMSRGSLSI